MISGFFFWIQKEYLFKDHLYANKTKYIQVITVFQRCTSYSSFWSSWILGMF